MSVTIGRKQIILAVLVIALGAAIYLNYAFSGSNVSGVFNSGATIGSASYVSSKSTTSAVTGSTTNYFSTARLTRQQTRDKAIDVLKTQVASSSVTAADKQSAEAAIENISKNIVTEGQIESTIKAKGFTDCVAFINDKRRDGR
jgi:stage III sporulation protein AH